MKFFSPSLEISEVSLVGGKGHNLQKLVSWQANIPDFFVITTQVYDEYKSTGTVPEIVTEKILNLLAQNKTIVLRSSMIAEDQFDASFAGMFETILNVNVENWKTSLIKIYESLSAPRVKEYLLQKNLSIDLKMAVIAQVQIQVEKSGVMFTRSPVYPTSSVAIDAGWGMGEGVVSGLTDVDHHLLTRRGEVISEVIRNVRPVLTKNEINTLINLGLDLEKKSLEASDIEWGFLNGELYIFQIRPITRTFPQLHFFVDTNLSESYPGAVSPLTGAFVQRAYENVFIESAQLLGASGTQLKTLKYHYARIIGNVDNHLYYNLEHYYAILRALPGGETNIKNWHKMIGGRPEGIEIPYHDTSLGMWDTIKAFGKLILMAFSKNKINQKFLERLSLIQKELEARSQKLSTSRETIEYLNLLINKPLGFGLTVINDVFIMFGLGYLTRALRKKSLPETAVIDLLKTSHDIDSLSPLIEMEKMVKVFSDKFITDLKGLTLKPGIDPYPLIFKNLEDLGWTMESQHLRIFIKKFGDRSFEELKLESLPLKNDPALFLKLLDWIRTQPIIHRPSPAEKSQISLNWLDKKMVEFTKECIAMRESTRLWRGRFYHVLRELILRLEQQLKFEDKRFDQFKLHQFFSITHSEWLEYSKGLLSIVDLEKKIIEREDWKITRHYPEMIIWSQTEKLPDYSLTTDFTEELRGQGVSPGIIEGTALVLDNPEAAFASDLKDFILVTRNTDPAWVYIMSRSLGLLSEKGSLLSHTAIIGRELGIPTLVGVRNATQKIPNGARIRIDGTSGKVEIL